MPGEYSTPESGVMKPGWYPDPFSSDETYVRYWDGSQWQRSATKDSVPLVEMQPTGVGAAGLSDLGFSPERIQVKDKHGVVALVLLFLGLAVGFIPVVGWAMFLMLPAGLAIGFIGGVKALRQHRTAFLSWLSVGIGVMLVGVMLIGLLVLLAGDWSYAP